jgi:hypothetical protein
MSLTFISFLRAAFHSRLLAFSGEESETVVGQAAMVFKANLFLLPVRVGVNREVFLAVIMGSLRWAVWMVMSPR